MYHYRPTSLMVWMTMHFSIEAKSNAWLFHVHGQGLDLLYFFNVDISESVENDAPIIFKDFLRNIKNK